MSENNNKKEISDKKNQNEKKVDSKKKKYDISYYDWIFDREWLKTKK
jgi:hypothetical protein